MPPSIGMHGGGQHAGPLPGGGGGAAANVKATAQNNKLKVSMCLIFIFNYLQKAQIGEIKQLIFTLQALLFNEMP